MAPMDLCAIDKLFAKSVPHILEKIFFSLDYESYKHCLEVNTKWNALLISESYLKIGRSMFQDDIANDEKTLLLWIARDGNEKEVRRLGLNSIELPSFLPSFLLSFETCPNYFSYY